MYMKPAQRAGPGVDLLDRPVGHLQGVETDSDEAGPAGNPAHSLRSINAGSRVEGAAGAGPFAGEFVAAVRT
jgi:hypothetical protein